MADFHMLFIYIVIYAGCIQSAIATYSEDVENVFRDLTGERPGMSACITTARNRMEDFSNSEKDKMYATGIINLFTQECPVGTAFYRELNEKLRREQAGGVWKSAGDLINEAIDLLPSDVYPRVFRGCRQFDKIPTEGEKCFQFKQITSATVDLSTAINFAGTCGYLFKINNVKGLPVREFSNFPDENEIILKSSHTFQVKRVTKDLMKMKLELGETSLKKINTLIILEGGDSGMNPRCELVSSQGCKTVPSIRYLIFIVMILSYFCNK